MPINLNTYVIVDLETGGLNTETCEVCEIAAIAVHPRSLEVIEGATFQSLMRPLDMNNLSQQALDINKLTREELAEAPLRDVVWADFVDFVKQFNPKGNSPYTAPIMCGKNIMNFDKPILDRLCRHYKNVDKDGVPNLFNQKTIFDIEHDLWRWHENSKLLPKLSFDTIRPILGIPTDNSHRAMKDVNDTYVLMKKFLQLYRRQSPLVKWAGSCA